MVATYDFTPHRISDPLHTTDCRSTRGRAAFTDRTHPEAPAEVVEKRPGQVLVAFAAETQNLSENAAKKLDKKNVDFIVGNDVTRPGAGFDVDTNIITIFDRSGATELPMMKKTEAADKILDHVLKFF